MVVDGVLETMTKWIAACRLDASATTRDGFYIDIDAFEFEGEQLAVRGARVRQELQRTIRKGGESTAQLFSGFRGTGKTTELHQLKRLLEDDPSGRYVVWLIDATQWVTTADAPTVTELALALSGAIATAAEAYAKYSSLSTPLPEAPVWERMWDFLTETHVELEEIGLSVGEAASLKFAVRSASPRFRAELNKQLAARPELLRQFLHETVSKVTAMLKEEGKNLVVLVDGLEKFDVGIARASEVYDEVARLFANHEDMWELPACHVVYTVPPYLEHFSAGVARAYRGSIRILPSIKVCGRPPQREAVPAGTAALRALLEQRIGDLRALFGEDEAEAVALLAAASGGHVRDFFALAGEAIEQADEELPLSTDDVKRAVRSLQHPNNHMWPQDTQDLLREIYDGTPPQGQAAALAVAMDQSLVLGYRNGDTWYDVHPLARARFEQR